MGSPNAMLCSPLSLAEVTNPHPAHTEGAHCPPQAVRPQAVWCRAAGWCVRRYRCYCDMSSFHYILFSLLKFPKHCIFKHWNWFPSEVVDASCLSVLRNIWAMLWITSFNCCLKWLGSWAWMTFVGSFWLSYFVLNLFIREMQVLLDDLWQTFVERLMLLIVASFGKNTFLYSSVKQKLSGTLWRTLLGLILKGFKRFLQVFFLFFFVWYL